MVAAVLVACGVAVLVGTFFAARLTRPEPPPGPEPDPSDPWSLLAPRPVEEVEPRRVRVWPILAFCLGAALVGVGIAFLEDPAAEGPGREALEAEPTPDPFRIEVSAAALTPPSPEPTPAPTPEPTPSPTPVAGSQQATAGGPAPPQAGGGGGSSTGEAPPPPQPTPTPAPPPGPSVGASTSCFNGSLAIEYTATARSGTTLSSLRVTLNGATVREPQVAGQTQHSGSFQTTVEPGSYELALIAHGSDGGVSHRTYPVTCH